MLKIKDIIKEIEEYAPLPLQEGFDNAGVQVGDVNQEATGALLCLDVTEEVIDEALESECNLIISHHPLAFRSFKSLTGKTYVELIGLQNVRVLSPQKEALLKLVTFVPDAYADLVRTTLFTAGAGHIGNYDSTSFNLHGEGTFRANEGCNPFCGEIGELHLEHEVRIEMVLPAFRKSNVLRALLSVHPYEEPVYDFYPLANTWEQVGSGIVGELPEEEDEMSFLQRIKDLFHVGCVKYSALTGRPIREVALCSGSGAFLINDAIHYGADVFITGEAKYNDFYDVEDRILLAVIGHYESEICTKDIFYSVISKKFPTFALHLSNVNSNPVKYL